MISNCDSACLSVRIVGIRKTGLYRLIRTSSLSFSADLSQDCKTLLHDFLERWSDIAANTITIGKSLVLYKPAIFYRLEHDRLLIVGEAQKICQKLDNLQNIVVEFAKILNGIKNLILLVINLLKLIKLKKLF